MFGFGKDPYNDDAHIIKKTSKKSKDVESQSYYDDGHDEDKPYEDALSFEEFEKMQKEEALDKLMEDEDFMKAFEKSSADKEGIKQCAKEILDKYPGLVEEVLNSDDGYIGDDDDDDYEYEEPEYYDNRGPFGKFVAISLTAFMGFIVIALIIATAIPLINVIAGKGTIERREQFPNAIEKVLTPEDDELTH